MSVTIVFIFIFFLYFLLLGMMIYAWRRCIAPSTTHRYAAKTFASIVIAARNESQTIGALLEDLRQQTHGNFNAVVVDDHSTDETADVVRAFVEKDSRFSIVPNSSEGKKAALTTGVKLSEGEIIVTTDADCHVGKQWLESIVGHFQENETKFVFGGVRIDGQSFFATLQSHEFLSLIGTAATTLWWGFPSMCNGANLAFRKSVFLEVGGYENNFHIPSGDDEFLMHKIFNRYPAGVSFVSDRQAIVRTSAVAPREFIHQRVRWAGKWSHNLSMWNIVLAIFIFLFQVAILVLPIAVFTGLIDLYLGLALLFVKAGTECVFLRNVAHFSAVRWRWPAFLALQIIYPVYAVFIAMISNSFSFDWKGRTLKSFTISTVKK